MNTQTQEVPLIELLKAVPKTARLIVESEDGISSRAHPVGDLCHKAAEALETKQVCENAAPAQDTETMAVAIALQEQIRQLKEQPAQKPLSDDDIFKIASTIEQIKPQYGMMLSNEWNILDFARAIEQAHGIGVKE